MAIISKRLSIFKPIKGETMNGSRWSAIKSKISDLISRYKDLQSENAELEVQVTTLQSHVNELRVKIEGQKSNGVNSQDWHLMQTQMARKDVMIENLELEMEKAEKRVQELEEMLLFKDSTLQVQKNTINELTEQNKLIKLAKEMSSGKGDTHELKIKINELIRDIDRCIDLLND